MKIAAERIDYVDGDLPLAGLLIRPSQQPRAAVLVLPTIRGCDDVILHRAGLLTELGYAAFIADFYGRSFDQPADMMAAGRNLMDDLPAFRARLAAALHALDGLLQLPRARTAVIGHCMGGAGALELARAGHDFAAAVSFHGLLATTMPARAGGIKPRLLVCHGHLDTLVPPDQVRAFESEMDDAGADWHLHIYARARHGFTNFAANAAGNQAVAFDASADNHSWRAMTTLFDEVFGSPSDVRQRLTFAMCIGRFRPSTQNEGRKIALPTLGRDPDGLLFGGFHRISLVGLAVAIGIPCIRGTIAVTIPSIRRAVTIGIDGGRRHLRRSARLRARRIHRRRGGRGHRRRRGIGGG